MKRMYRKHLTDAIKELNLSITYAEDGAPFEAKRCAERAIALLDKAHKSRTELINSLMEKEKA